MRRFSAFREHFSGQRQNNKQTNEKKKNTKNRQKSETTLIMKRSARRPWQSVNDQPNICTADDDSRPCKHGPHNDTSEIRWRYTAIRTNIRDLYRKYVFAKHILGFQGEYNSYSGRFKYRIRKFISFGILWGEGWRTFKFQLLLIRENESHEENPAITSRRNRSLSPNFFRSRNIVATIDNT